MARKYRERFKTNNDVFDEFTLRNLFIMDSKGFFDQESLSPFSIGKEANLFMANRDNEKVAVKIYRLETADFNKMYEYIKPDPRYEGLSKSKRAVIFAWAQREYRNLLAARQALIPAPLPIAFHKNILVMSLIGKTTPAPKMKDSFPKDPEKFLKTIILHVKKFYKEGLVHGDLSKFNILNDNESPVLIDYSQASPLRSQNSDLMLRRDIKNICSFFKKEKVPCNENKIYYQITSSRA